MELTTILDQLDEAEETVIFLRREIGWLAQLLAYWETRERKLKEALPGLAEAERTAAEAWGE